jgi:hypothetical protein
MNSKFDKKIKEIREKTLPILKKYKIKKAGLFGSVTRNEDKKTSDVDILVEFVDGAKVSLFDFVGIEQELESSLGKEVDLVQYKSIKPALRKYILPSEIKIYEKNS